MMTSAVEVDKLKREQVVPGLHLTVDEALASIEETESSSESGWVSLIDVLEEVRSRYAAYAS
jgi:hypothetical protein